MKGANIDDPYIRDQLERDGINLAHHRPGDLVPWNGGDLFVCLAKNGSLVRVNADINAAQNLQRRFWTRHATAFRISTRRVVVDGEERWVPRGFGKRLRGAMQGYGALMPTGHKSGSCRWRALKPAAFRKLGGEVDASEERQVADAELEELAGLADEAIEQSSDRETFFRDPSGVVLPDGLWYPAKTFWSIVMTTTAKSIRSELEARCGAH